MADQLTVYEFGQQLLNTNDLDPVYVILHEAQLEPSDLQHWLLAYWCFYHVGTASAIASGQTGYWGRMHAAAGSKEWPRSSERRHFRGQQAINSVTYLQERGVQDLFAPLLEGPYTAQQVMGHVQEWRGFGPWIAFKVADMIDRLGLGVVHFDAATVLYDSPQKAAELLYSRENPTKVVRPDVAGPWALQRVVGELGRAKAPPRYERPFGLQEAETVLCKWKSYLGGHYHVGEDVEAVRNGLLRYARNPLCQRLLKAGKKGGLW